MRNDLGRRVKAFRYRNGYSQGRFAVRVGVTQPYISCLEKGTVTPSAELVDRIEKLLEVLTAAENAASAARNRVLAGLTDSISKQPNSMDLR